MMERMLNRIKRVFFMLMAAWIIAAGYALPVYAGEELQETEFDQFMKALQPIDAKAEPADDAQTIFSYDVGDTVYVTGETGDGWIIVFYQGQTGYIKNSASNVAEPAQDAEDGQDEQDEQSVQAGQNEQDAQIILDFEEIDTEALDEELEAMEMENKLIVDELERYRAETLRSRIWGTVIVLLVIGIFAVGIIATVGSEKGKKKDNGAEDE